MTWTTILRHGNIVLGKEDGGCNGYYTRQFDPKNLDNEFWGHYCLSFPEALRDMADRIESANYQKEVKT